MHNVRYKPPNLKASPIANIPQPIFPFIKCISVTKYLKKYNNHYKYRGQWIIIYFRLFYRFLLQNYLKR